MERGQLSVSIFLTCVTPYLRRAQGSRQACVWPVGTFLGSAASPLFRGCSVTPAALVSVAAAYQADGFKWLLWMKRFFFGVLSVVFIAFCDHSSQKRSGDLTPQSPSCPLMLSVSRLPERHTGRWGACSPGAPVLMAKKRQ